ncbi:MAG: gluconate kinase [Cellvibrionaceae bacterium]|jgi:gluconate kinase
MIVILNGSVGVGKSSTSWELATRYDPSFMLDGDFLGAVHPFEIYDQARVDYLYETLNHLIQFHQSNDYANFVVNYVFEHPFQLALLTDRLKESDDDIHAFWLTCDEAVQTKRVKSRKPDHQWDLKRFVELNRILRASSEEGFIGRKIDTTHLSIPEVADTIGSIISG